MCFYFLSLDAAIFFFFFLHSLHVHVVTHIVQVYCAVAHVIPINWLRMCVKPTGTTSMLYHLFWGRYFFTGYAAE